VRENNPRPEPLTPDRRDAAAARSEAASACEDSRRDAASARANTDQVHTIYPLNTCLMSEAASAVSACEDARRDARASTDQVHFFAEGGLSSSSLLLSSLELSDTTIYEP